LGPRIRIFSISINAEAQPRSGACCSTAIQDDV
jgi:hypothetical protein